MSAHPFILSRIGWGYFEVHIEIEFKKWTKIPKMELDHMLSFEDGGKQGAFFIEAEKESINANADSSLIT